MKITSLVLRHFRLFELLALEFYPGLNHFSGPNAQGKTTLLEALFLLCSGRSMRTRHLDQLVKENEERFGISCSFERHGIAQHIDLYSTGKEHELTINATRSHRLHALLGLCQGVVITPEDIQIIKGGPEERRRFIDQHICTTSPLYVHHLHRYKRALKQRAALLKMRAFATISAWEHQLASSAAFIVKERLFTIKELNTRAAKLILKLSGDAEALEITYKISSHAEKCSDLESYYIEQFAKHREKDALFQTTTIGPHRDDIHIVLNEKNARAFASEGQKKSIVCALRLAQWHELKERGNEAPFLGIDDIGACLDEKRLSSLTEQLFDMGQVFITSPGPCPLKEAKTFHLNLGQVQLLAEV